MKKVQEESDLIKYELHDKNKLLTEKSLKIDYLETKIEGL